MKKSATPAVANTTTATATITTAEATEAAAAAATTTTTASTTTTTTIIVGQPLPPLMNPVVVLEDCIAKTKKPEAVKEMTKKQETKDIVIRKQETKETPKKQESKATPKKQETKETPKKQDGKESSKKQETKEAIKEQETKDTAKKTETGEAKKKVETVETTKKLDLQETTAVTATRKRKAASPPATKTPNEKEKKTSDDLAAKETGHDWCAALVCVNTSEKNSNLSFFPFPRDSDRCKTWVRNAGREDMLNRPADQLNKTATLCAIHFEDDQFVNPQTKKRLRWDAIPTIFRASATGMTRSKGSNSATTTVKQKNITPSRTPIQPTPDLNTNVIVPATESARKRTRGRPKSIPTVVQATATKESVPPMDYLQSISKHLPESMLSLMKIYRQRLRRNNKWTKSGKRLAIVLYVHFYKRYLALGKWFHLPSKKLLKNWLNFEQFFPGIHTNHLRILHDVDMFERCKEASTRMEKKSTALIMYKLKLKSKLEYNVMHDRIEGLQDLDYIGKSRHLATHAIVFMAKGMMTDWRLPVGYYPIYKGISTALVAKLLFETLYELESTGLNVRVLICSHTSYSRQLLDFYGVTTIRPFIYFMGRRVMVMYDPPGLLKTLLAAFREQDIIFGDKKYAASWKHVEKFYAVDSTLKYPLVPELSAKYFDKTKKMKFTTKMATDIFQYKLSAALAFASRSGDCPEAAAATADFLKSVAELYDYFCLPNKNVLPEVAVNGSDVSPYSKALTSFMTKLKQWTYVSGEEPKPCLQAWHMTLMTVSQLLFDMHKCGPIRKLKTNGLRLKDEEFYRLLRSKATPGTLTSVQCREVIRQLSVNTLLQPMKLHCLKLENVFFPKVVMRLSTELKSSADEARKTFTEAPETKYVNRFPTSNSLSYMAGYIVNEVFKKHDKCKICRNNWTRTCSITIGAIELYILWFEKVKGISFPSEEVVVPSEKFIDLMKKCEESFAKCFSRVIHMARPLMRMVLLLRTHLKDEMKDMCLPSRNFFLKRFVRYQIVNTISSFRFKGKNKWMIANNSLKQIRSKNGENK